MNKNLQTEATHRILPTNMTRRKKIVLKTRYDQPIIKLVAEKLKEKVFPRKGFHKPKVPDVELTSCEKYYEQYLIIRGKYSIDHCKSLVYNLEVEKDAQKIFLLNETLKPEPYSTTNSEDYNTIKLTGVASFHYEDESYCIIDTQGKEVDSKKLDDFLHEQWHKETLTKSGLRKELPKFQISPQEEVNILRSKLVKRPSHCGEIIKEIFEINERKIIYIPMFKLNFQNTKTKKEAIIQINGINGKIVLITLDNKTFPRKIIEDLDRTYSKTIKPTSLKDEKSTKSSSNKILKPIKNESKVLAESRINKKIKEKTKKKKFEFKPLSFSKSSKVKIDEKNIEFPAKVIGDVFHVGDKITAIVGDLEIPSGTTVYDTLVVKGNLKIGKKCNMHGTIKALGNIIIGAQTIIKGNVISYQNVSVGPKVKIYGEVIVKKALHSEALTAFGNVNE